jgi:2'-5' RNA ligase
VSTAGERSPRKLRLFFALWPVDRHRAAVAESVAAAVARVAGRAVPPGNLHVTLAFLGSVPAEAFVQLVGVGGRGPWPEVGLDFTRIEYWARPKVLVAMPAEVPAAGQEIVERLWQGVAALGFTRELRPWRPHLTLVRGVRQPPPENLELTPVQTAADEPAWRLALVDSAAHPEGPRYNPLADWPLGGV